MRKWKIEDSAELYNVNGWGRQYFGINDKGHIIVTPRQGEASVDLKEVMDELQVRDVTAPVLLRFPDILDNRIEKISNCFARAKQLEIFSMRLSRMSGKRRSTGAVTSRTCSSSITSLRSTEASPCLGVTMMWPLSLMPKYWRPQPLTL